VSPWLACCAAIHAQQGGYWAGCSCNELSVRSDSLLPIAPSRGSNPGALTMSCQAAGGSGCAVVRGARDAGRAAVPCRTSGVAGAAGVAGRTGPPLAAARLLTCFRSEHRSRSCRSASRLNAVTVPAGEWWCAAIQAGDQGCDCNPACLHCCRLFHQYRAMQGATTGVLFAGSAGTK